MYLICTAQVHFPKFFKPSLESIKGTSRLQPWFTIRRVSWLYTVAYTNGCHKDYKGDWLHRGLSHSFWRQDGICVYQSRRPVRPWVCYPHGYQAHGPKLTVSARWSFLLCQDGVSMACSFPPSTPWTIACQAPLSTEFPRQFYWSGISFYGKSSQPRDLTQVSHIAGRFFTIWATTEAYQKSCCCC